MREQTLEERKRSVALTKFGKIILVALVLILVLNSCAQTSQKLEFKKGKNVTGATSDGGSFELQEYISSDGVKVTYFVSTHPSPEAATERLRQMQVGDEKSKVKINERGPKTDVNNRPVGERIVATLSFPNQKEPSEDILWTDQSSFHDISSTSLRHALEFEKSLQPKP